MRYRGCFIWLVSCAVHGWTLGQVADYFHVEASCPEYGPTLLVSSAPRAVCGVPLSSNKTAGNDIVSWVGFELMHKTYPQGISARWSGKVETLDRRGTYEEGLGRVMCVAGGSCARAAVSRTAVHVHNRAPARIHTDFASQRPRLRVPALVFEDGSQQFRRRVRWTSGGQSGVVTRSHEKRWW